jgi:hypothetical protein
MLKANLIHNKKNKFEKIAKEIHEKHKKQTVDDVNILNEKYKKNNIFDKPIETWLAIEKLAQVSDPTDKQLYTVSQWVHTLQVIEGMENDKVKDEMMYVSGWLHDLGKLLLITNEDPANIVCDNYVIHGQKNIGLNNCVLNWNHDEFIYLKLKDIIPKDYLWLIRYHSINIKQCSDYFDNYDKKMIEKLLIPFKKYDKQTKSIYNYPKLNLNFYKKIIEKNLNKIIL